MKFFIDWDVKGYLESLQWEKDNCIKVDFSLSRAKLKDNSHIHKEMHYNPQDDLRSNILGLNLEGWYAVTYYYILKLMILSFHLSKTLLVLVRTFGISWVVQTFAAEEVYSLHLLRHYSVMMGMDEQAL